LVLVKGGLGCLKGRLEILVVQGRLDHFVAVGLEVRRLHAPYNRVPAVEVEDFHRLAPLTAAA